MNPLTRTAEEERLEAYVAAQLREHDPVTAALVQETHDVGELAIMQVPVVQAALLTLLTRLTAARLVVEVGTFTGLSTLALARGLPPGGRVLTYDLEPRWTEVAERHWDLAGVRDRIELHLGPASEGLALLPPEPCIDLAFVDADKTGYEAYWELLVPRLRPGGLLLADNVLYEGEAADPDATGNGLAIRRFNEHVLRDDRVESLLLPVFDGLTIARRTA